MSTHAPTRRLPRSLLLTLSVTIIFTIVARIVAVIDGLRGLPKPYSWPYIVPNDNFADLTNSIERFHYYGNADFFSPAYGQQFLYPSPMALFYRIFLPTFAHPVPEFFAFVIATVFIAATILVIRLKANGLSSSTAVTYILATALLSPVLIFELQRSNLEIIPFIFIASFIYLFTSRRPVLAGVMLGGAIALKFYPVILLGLLLTRKTYRAATAALLSAGCWMLLGLYTETPSILESARGTAKGLAFFTTQYAENAHAGVGWDHSVFALVKLAVFLNGGSIIHALHVYLPLAALAGLLCYGLRIWKLPIFNQVTAFSIFSILLPPVSFEYTLLQILPAFALFCCMAVRQQDDKSIAERFNAVGICFGLLFSPLGFAIIHGHMLNGQLKSLVLIFLLVYVLRFPFYDASLDSSSTLAV